MLVFKRNQIVISALIVVILCAGYLNFRYNKAKLTDTTGKSPIGSAYLVQNTNDPGSDTTPVAKVNGDYFIVSRAEKERARADEQDMMQSIINNKDLDKAAKDKAQAELTRIARSIEKEMIIENVLKGKGFQDVIAFLNDGKVDIVIKDDKNLLPSQTAMILDVVTRETEVSAENVRINPQKDSLEKDKKN